MNKQLSSYKQILKWLLRFWQAHRVQALLNTTMGILLVALNLAFVAATKLAIDIATGQSHRFALSTALCILCAIMVAQIVLGFSNRWIKAILGVKSQNRMQEKMFNRLLNSEWMHIRHYHSGDVLNRLLKDVGSLVNLITEDIPSFITTFVQFVGAFFFLYYMDETLALVVVVVTPFFLLVSKLYVRRLRGITHEVREIESNVQSWLQESLQHSLVVKTLERVDYVVNKLSDTHTNLRGKVVEKTKYSSISATLLNIGFGIGYLLTFTWGVFQLQAHAITYGALLAFIQLVGQIQTPVRNLSRYIPIFINSTTACERLMELENLLAENNVEDASIPTKLGNRSFEGLVLEGVSYQYTPNSRAILKNFSYTFPSGSITAIVGETGAGKTTLVRVLMSLVHPQDGESKVLFTDGIVEHLTTAHRYLFSYVPQGNTLLSGTIRENLQMGNPHATDDMMHEALRIAAAKFVFKLPLGLDTPCTELGGGLSEGQAQRICIARALLRDASIFLFDESTSALDAATEEKVIDNIIDYCKGKTLIFITHRPSVLRYATQQLSLERLNAE